MDSLEKNSMLGKIEGKRKRERQRVRWLGATTNSMGMNLGKLREMMEERVWRAIVHEVAKSQT